MAAGRRRRGGCGGEDAAGVRRRGSEERSGVGRRSGDGGVVVGVRRCSGWGEELRRVWVTGLGDGGWVVNWRCSAGDRASLSP